MRAGRRRRQGRPHGHRYFPPRRLPAGDRATAASRPRRWCWRPAACRSRKWGRPVLPTRSRAASGCGSREPLPALVPLERDAGRRSGFASVLAGVSLEAIVSCARRRASARTSCSPITASRVRPFCRSPPTGGRRNASGSTWCRTATPRLSAWSASRRGRGRGQDRAGRNAARPAWRRRWREAGLPAGTDGQYSRPHAGGVCGAPQALGGSADRLGGLGQGGGDARGHRYQGPVLARPWRRARFPGLYAIGEALDVTGWLGGYNFQWAWSSGWCAGQAV